MGWLGRGRGELAAGSAGCGMRDSVGEIPSIVTVQSVTDSSYWPVSAGVKFTDRRNGFDCSYTDRIPDQRRINRMSPTMNPVFVVRSTDSCQRRILLSWLYIPLSAEE